MKTRYRFWQVGISRNGGHLRKSNTLKKVTQTLHDYLNMDKIPLIILAVEKQEILGAAQLKYREMDIYPEKEHWLGGVYVAKKHRGNTIATQIVHKVVSVAAQLDVKTLFLQTQRPDGGLYTHLGWKPIEKVNHHGLDVLVMGNEISV